MKKRYCIIRQSKDDLGLPDPEVGADYTADVFAEIDPDEMQQKGWVCVYIHFDDIGSDVDLWTRINDKCKQTGLQIFYFTKQNISTMKVEAPDGSEQVYLYGWEQLKGHLGHVNHPTHRPPVELEYLPALAVLCQGYLAVHAQYTGKGKQWTDDDIRSALDLMGWSEYMKEPSRGLIRSDLGEQLTVVQRPSWWLTPFGLWDESGGSLVNDDGRINSFRDKIEKEWELSENQPTAEDKTQFFKLIDVLTAGYLLEQPRVVASAFSALMIRLASEA